MTQDGDEELKPEGGGEALDDNSAAALRDLIKLGPAAVPDDGSVACRKQAKRDSR